jgi:predicted DsbA family dithiol-disulfide isomerase
MPTFTFIYRCYVGQQRLHKAISQFEEQNGGETKVSVEWKPFMIDPGTNPNGESVEDYCRRRWGGSGWTRSLKTSGARDGAKFANWKYWPHTLKAHQLVQYCESKGISTDKVNQLLFQREYEEGENISNVPTLVSIGKDLGMDEQDLSTYLSENRGEAEVKEAINSGRRRYNISGVPFFVVGSDKTSRPYGFSGAQEPNTLLELFNELSEK